MPQKAWRAYDLKHPDGPGQGRVNHPAPPFRPTSMDTLKDELELAVPRVDPGPAGTEQLLTAGHRAVRRRRARVGGVIAAGGLVVATVAVGAVDVLAPDRAQRATEPAVATAPTAPRASSAPEVRKVPLSLESLLEVSGRCPRGSGGDLDRIDALWIDDGLAAVELACGEGSVRVLQTPDGELVDRYRVEQRSTLEEWAEAKVG